MASPIFISNPSHTFSLWIVLRGVQFSILSGYRCCQNSLLIWEIAPQFWPIIKLSLSLYVLTNGPVYLTNLVIISLNYLFNFHINNHDLIENLTYIINNLNLPIFLIGCMRYYHVVDFDHLFLSNLKFIDSTINTQFHAKIIRLPQNPTNHFPQFLSRYGKFYILCALVFSLIQFPSHISSLALALLSFQTFLDKIGTLPSLLLISVLNLLPYHYTVKILIGFYSSSLLARDLLSPYFDRIKFSNFEKKQWLKSREGVLFGFCLTTYCLIYNFPQLSFILYLAAQMSIAYLITKITSEPPSKTHKLVNWTGTQLVWNDCEVVSGNFVNDPFIGLPGWFIFV